MKIHHSRESDTNTSNLFNILLINAIFNFYQLWYKPTQVVKVEELREASNKKSTFLCNIIVK